jgi:predicted transcriptional regulator
MNNDEQNPTYPQQILDIIDLPDELRQIVNWIIRQKQVTLQEVITHTNLSESVAQEHLQTLVDGGFIQELNDNGLCYYQSRLGKKRKSQLPRNLLNKLNDDDGTA